MAKIAVGLSGGVDSSVAAGLLVAQGHDVAGITMEIWAGSCDTPVENHLGKHGCYGPGEAEDTRDASRVARTLGIPFHVYDLREQYAEEVIAYTRNEYKSGRTPNPCVVCNRMIKFEALLKHASSQGLDFEYFATGHYVNLQYVKSRERFCLSRGDYQEKDQSYFLFRLSQEQLSRCMFPLGGYTKAEVRQIASEMGLDVHDKAESQDFADSSYTSVIGVTGTPGPILDLDGNVIGQHQGVENYTIGQRKGLGIAAAEPLYVVSINSEDNTIIAGNKSSVYASGLTASDINWISIECPAHQLRTTAKIRYAHQPAPCTITPLPDNSVRVDFDEQQLAVTPGQAVVFYDNNTLLGGGTIEDSFG